MREAFEALNILVEPLTALGFRKGTAVQIIQESYPMLGGGFRAGYEGD